MRPRCVELHRVLKKTGSFYYHCDWHASHYVKVMLDQIFGENFFQNEIIWKRTSSHNDPQKYGNIHDSIFFYSAGKEHTWNVQYTDYDPDYLKAEFRVDEETKRLVKYENLTGAGKTKGSSGQAWRGVDPSKSGRHWAIPSRVLRQFGIDEKLSTQEKLEKLLTAGRIKTDKNGMPLMRGLKTFLDELPGMPLQTLWLDIPKVGNTAKERLGYPTQKPLPLLERIITASSDENAIILDAFCGCGTALVAAQKLKRQWIGIDISPTACRVMAKRLKKDCGLKEDEKLQQIGRGFVVRDLPKTEEELRKYPPFEFENWAVVALGGTKNARQVGDMGIDGRIYPISAMPERRGARTGEMDFMDEWYPIQVKQTAKVGRPDIDAFEAVMMREERMLGYFVGFDFTGAALFEIDRFRRKEGREIKALTVREILDEEVAAKD